MERSIRPAVPADADAWAALRSRLWPDADPASLLAETRAFLAGDDVDVLAAAFLATGASGPIGFVELSIRPFADGCASRPVPHVEGWFVEEPARGRGIGRALMTSAEAWARARGFTELASDAELDNEGSLRAHTGCGFVETERLVKFRKALDDRVRTQGEPR